MIYQIILELDSNDYPHISYYDDKNDTLGYTYYDGATWIDTAVTADDSNDRGRHGSIGLDSNDYPRIAYHNTTGSNLELAIWDGSSWIFEKVDDPASGNAGLYPSLQIDSYDLTQIAYYGENSNSIKYATNDGSNWNIEEINTFNIQISTSTPIRLGIDSLNNPRITTVDFAGTDNVVVIYNNGGKWYKYDVEDNSGKHSNWPDSFVDSEGTVHIAYVDNNNNHRLVRYTTVYTDTVWHKNDLVEISTPSGVKNFEIIDVKYI